MEYKILPQDEQFRNKLLADSENLRVFEVLVETPYEKKMMGGTPQPWNYLVEHKENKDLMHTPTGILMQRDGDPRYQDLTVEEVNLIREKLQYRIINVIPLLFLLDPETGKMKKDKDFDMGTMLAVSFEPLDPETGITIQDPRILGVCDKETKTYQEIPGRDLTAEYYQTLKKFDEFHPNPEDELGSLWYAERDKKSVSETDKPGELEKE